ncbi:MAG: hypothetical protein FWF87_08350 [Synergistaceae bacterium]|nr:hypothetical protein [Synergistaceae bacterium]
MSELLKKNEMTEEDIKLRYITPAIARKWDKHTQIRMEYCFTDGRVIVRGSIVARGKKKKATAKDISAGATPYLLQYL